MIARPFLKWAGSKRRLVPKLLELAPKHCRLYVEPFCGSGALYIAMASVGRMEKAWLNDSERDLMQLLREAIENVDELIADTLALIANHCPEHYYAVRSQPLSPANLLYLNRTCFNGLYRKNNAGQFNVPIGQYKVINLPASDIHMWSTLSRKIMPMMTTDDFQSVLEKVTLNSNDFVYFDSPYAGEKGSFTKYAQKDFKLEDHMRLADTYLELTRQGIPAMISNADTDLVRELYADDRYSWHHVQVRRPINSKKEGRGAVGEVIITNF